MAAAGAGVLVALQLLPAPPRTNPPVRTADGIEASLEVSLEIAALLRRSCANCHSNQTRWPWYSRLAPGSWMVGSHVEKGRRAMNFSEWRDRTEGRPGAAIASLAASCAAAQAGRMPPSSYLLLHPEARLSEADKRSLCAWTEAQMARLARVAAQSRARRHSQYQNSLSPGPLAR